MALGGGREIGANSFYYNIDGHGILVDAGLHPEKLGWEGFPRISALGDRQVNTFLITHAHTDHLGAVPYILQHYPDCKVYATPETIELARIMLENSAGLIPKQHPSEVVNALTLYSLVELPQVLAKLQPLRLGETVELAEGRIKVTFYASGHILGAAGILFECDGMRMFHTGDTSLHEQRLVGGAKLPHGPMNILVSESTNGVVDAYLTHSREREYERLLETISDTIEDEGSVLIPVFALGKLQEMLTMLYDGMKAGRIPEVPIYTGGMGRKISEVYDNCVLSESRRDHEQLVSAIPQSDLPKRDQLFSGAFFRDPSIVLAASGMMQEGTPSYFLAQRWLRLPNFTIAFVGYTDPRTPGYVVSHAETGTRIRFGAMKRDVPVRCKIDRFRFSAHARREELLEIAMRLKPAQVVLTHGDERAMAAFGELILENAPGTIVSAPEVGKAYRLS
jgi:cleavage and polyadenylation specificity factor subunit 3